MYRFLIYLITLTFAVGQDYSLSFDGVDDYVDFYNPNFNPQQSISLETIFRWDGSNDDNQGDYLLLFARNGPGNAYLTVYDGILYGTILQHNGGADN
ncbi:MAG: hypothetical protein VX820_03345, partial [Candidatus Neomarinimicrobiota bacterium]|nr:hypothetical protein [Candidatus Neomarinimicrobiota bacterium]